MLKAIAREEEGRQARSSAGGRDTGEERERGGRRSTSPLETSTGGGILETSTGGGSILELVFTVRGGGPLRGRTCETTRPIPFGAANRYRHRVVKPLPLAYRRLRIRMAMEEHRSIFLFHVSILGFTALFFLGEARLEAVRRLSREKDQ